jgi:hypothetical protein
MQSLVGFLRQRSSAPEVAVIAPGLPSDMCAEATVLSLPTAGAAIVDSPLLFPGTPVADLWFEPVSLITLTGVAPDSRYGLSAALVAQAELLAGVRGLDLDLVFEAHRLLAADLTIACGPRTSAGGPDIERWWAASTSDVALDHAIARAAGVSPASLPILRHLARHEVFQPSARNGGDEPPRLMGYVPRRWHSRAARARIRASYAASASLRDLRAAFANVRRTPQFLARRRPSWLAFGKAGA